MKTTANAQMKWGLVILVLFLSLPDGLYSQQVLKLKNGQEFKIYTVYKTKDTLKYHLPSESNVIRTILMNQVDTIQGTITLSNPSEEIFPPLIDRQSLHYKHMTTTGTVLAAGGGFIALGGIVIMSSARHTHDEFWGDTYDAKVGLGGVITGVGGIMALAGVILITTGTLSMENYQKKMRGFSWDVKYTPSMKGVSLVYRF